MGARRPKRIPERSYALLRNVARYALNATVQGIFFTGLIKECAFRGRGQNPISLRKTLSPVRYHKEKINLYHENFRR